jgi:hypothetical protein
VTVPVTLACYDPAITLKEEVNSCSVYSSPQLKDSQNR